MREYVIKQGDNFFLLAQKNGGCWQDYVAVNPGIDPCALYVGQKVVLPIIIEKEKPAVGGCAGVTGEGRCDDVFLEVEGVKFRVTRQGEPSLPHEVHLIIPRTEIRKVESPVNGIIETTIMLSNVNIVNSPRFEGESRTEVQQSE
ncbi:MAG: hypothetical protein APF84_10335 [Gracilibacter sp. BRH_c7a]|nr:MAG: hypothetical protein APF84_10335 [Gracilibacter sp. BRH_c7a]